MAQTRRPDHPPVTPRRPGGPSCLLRDLGGPSGLGGPACTPPPADEAQDDPRDVEEGGREESGEGEGAAPAAGVLGTRYSVGDVHRGTGLSRAQVSRVASGKRGTSPSSLSRIAGFLGLSMDELYGRIERVRQGAGGSGRVA